MDLFPGASALWKFACAAGGVVNNTAVTLAAAAGSNKKNYCSSIQMKNVHATVATEVAIRDGAGGTVIWRGYLPALMISADDIIFDPPLVGSNNTLMEFICLTTGTQTYVDAQGFQGV